MNEKNWRNFSAQQTAKAEQPVLISPAFDELIKGAEAEAKTKPEYREYAEALRRQVEFSAAEKHVADYETADPLGEQKYCVTPYLVHQYENRVLLLTTGTCLSYCRYCFRRGFTARKKGCITPQELQTVCAYISANSQITEVLVSGGDPLSCGFSTLKTILTALRNLRQNLIIRLCTRSPIFAPELFTPQLITLLRNCRPLWLIPHINHPVELGSAQRSALTSCIEAGIPMQSQTVLLQGINDSAETLVALFHTLTCLSIKPGYLFQLDAATGTSHFRVPLKKALELWKILEKKLSGLSCPKFAADLPDGGGKFPLSALISSDKIIEKYDNYSFSAIGIDNCIHKYTL